jgi:peptidyl-prolyl cis-trans isomerase D
MLKSLRENIRHLHWVLWIVIVAFVAITFTEVGYLGGEDPDAAATVGDVKITYSAFERQSRSLEERYRQMFGEQWSPEMSDQLGVPRQALETLINRQVLLLEASRLGLEANDEEVRQTILEIPSFQDADGRFIGSDRYGQLLRANGYTPESFEAAVREDLLAQKIQQVLSQNLYLSDRELEEAYRRQVEKARIRYVLLPQTRFAEAAAASPEELAEYLAAHPAEFQLPEQREVAYLLIDENMLRDQVEIPEAELRAYYQEHADEFAREEQVQARHVLLRTGERTVEEARQELAAVRSRIEAGEDFATVAAEVSEDPGSAQRGGDLGYFARGQMVPEFEEAAFGAGPGELVGPVESPFGVHLLEVTGRREAGQQPFEEAQAQIRFQLAQERLDALARERAAEAAGTLREVTAEERVERMRALAESNPALFVYEPDPFGRDDAVAGIGRSPEFTEAAFGLAEGALSSPVELPRGWAVIHAERALPPRSPELAEVEPQVRRAVETEKRGALARRALEAARAELEAGRSFDEVAGGLELSVQESGEFGAGAPITGLGLAPQVADAALALEEGAVGGPFATPQGAVLFEVSERTRFDPAQFEAAKDQTREQLLGQRAALLQNALIQQRRQELGVDYSRRVVEQYDLAGTGAGTGGDG